MDSTLAKSASTPSLAGATTRLPKLNVNAIPNLPGTQITDRLSKRHFPRQNTWSIIGGCRVERPRAEKTESRSRFCKAPRSTSVYRQGSLPSSTTRDVFAGNGVPLADSVELPAWEVLDKHVLRFYGYGKEEIAETNLENYRVKKYKFLYYLEDDTVQISMPEPDNSGCGVFSALGGQGDKGLSSNMLKRGKLMKADGSGYVSPADFRIGEDFSFLGRKVRIYNCDKFTEEYYERLGMAQNMGAADMGAAEADAFAETLAKKNVVPKKPERTNEKLYYENMLNGGHINKNMQQFMEKDRKVCRFYAIVDDLLTPQYERRPFIIMYFLADDTIQIREQYPLNSGRDGFPILCKRMRMPKGKMSLRGPMDSAYQDDEYVNIADFSIGQRLEMYNMSFFLYDADGFTREYFAKDMPQPLAEKIDVRLPEKDVPRAVTPPYTGYGSWDDSMASVISLIPKKPRKDLAKLFFNEGKTLRFSAKFSGEVNEEDTMRRFLMTYNLFDDTMQIHEPPQRNLGIVTGRFLEKAVHLNQLTGKLFRPDDFLPGKEMKVMSHQFLMLDMDEYTRNYFKSLENGEEIYRSNVNLNSVLRQLREQMTNQFPQVRDVFRRFDADRNGVLCYHEMERALQKFGFILSPEETLCVMKHFDEQGTGQIDYQQFCDKVLDPDFHGGNLMAVGDQRWRAGFVCGRRCAENGRTCRDGEGAPRRKDDWRHLFYTSRYAKEIASRMDRNVPSATQDLGSDPSRILETRIRLRSRGRSAVYLVLLAGLRLAESTGYRLHAQTKGLLSRHVLEPIN
ncbi:unnamed protein product [Amoebophrya sp. A25]|nr:unnamed protein product [Amoebophrya sp. A25]|eukprot:GSA25T00008914001.1